MDTNEIQNIVISLFEARYLKRIQRSGTSLLLGTAVNETVAEHSFYVSLWAIVYAHLDAEINLGKILTMCLVHDLEEVRTGDLNQINRMYLDAKTTSHSAFADMWQGSDLGNKLVILHNERLENQTKEARAANDCDLLAELVTEKEYLDRGNQEAQEWIEYTQQRLKTEIGRQLAQLVINTRMTKWWEDIKNKIRTQHGLPPKNYAQ